MNHRQLIIDELKKIKFDSLLDIGCGEAMDLELIKMEFPNIEIAGIDGNAERVIKANDKFEGKLMDKILVGDIKNLPFKSKSFDISLADAVLYQNNLVEIREIIREMRRVTNKYIFIIDNHSDSAYSSDERFNEYNVQNYKNILQELSFRNYTFIKITKDIWPGYPWEYWGYLIIAEV